MPDNGADIVQQQVKLGDVNFLLDLVDKINAALDKVDTSFFKTTNQTDFATVLEIGEQMQQVADRIRR